MTDIVEQLRSLKGLYATPPAPFTSKDVLTLMHEAAAEVERLRAEVERLQQAQQSNPWNWPPEIERLQAQIAMLRADNDALRAGLAGYQSWHRP